MHMHQGIVTRRALMGGFGLGAGAVVVGAAAGTASAASGSGPYSGGGSGGFAAAALDSIATPHEAGVTYRYCSPVDFKPLLASTMYAGENGHFAGPEDLLGSDPGGVLVCDIEIPIDAQLVDVEWYAQNTTGSDQMVGAWFWRPGVMAGSGDTIVLATELPPSETLSATRSLVEGPWAAAWPAGHRLVLGATTPMDGSVQINGARVGYRQDSASQVVMLAEPDRVYDSRSSGGVLAPNATRTISLSDAVPEGASGALITLSITGSSGSGTLRVGTAGVEPLATALQWSRTGDKVTNLVSTAVSGARAIAVKSAYSTGSVHVIVDVVGYLS